jgi:type I restriction enzyme S subunit
MKNVKLSEVTDSVEYGVTASASEEPIGPKFLRITDIQNGNVDWSSVPVRPMSRNSNPPA